VVSIVAPEADTGTVHIANDVVEVIAGIAATEVPGVAGMSGGLVGGITELLGKRNLSKGVKVDVSDNHATLDLYLAVEFGSRIPDVANEVQTRVKQAIESMTGLVVRQVHIHVQGVAFPPEGDGEASGPKHA
jgi:uncharacterized alkaline shock family protein YloU